MRTLLLSTAGAGVLAPPEREDPGFELGGPPPIDGGGGRDDDGDDDGNRGSSGADGQGSHQEPEAFSIGLLEVAFGLLLVAICTLFLTFLAASLFLRRSSVEWPPPGTPRVPGGLWWSTLILLVSSAAMTRFQSVLRRGDRARARRWLATTMGLGFAFLLAQGYLWRELIAEGLQTSNAYGTIFYSLTGLHAVHIVAGLVYVALVLVKLGRVASIDAARSSATFCGVYWHFMGAIWLALFATLSFLH